MIFYVLICVAIIYSINTFGWRYTGINEHRDLEHRVESLEKTIKGIQNIENMVRTET